MRREENFDARVWPLPRLLVGDLHDRRRNFTPVLDPALLVVSRRKLCARSTSRYVRRIAPRESLLELAVELVIESFLLKVTFLLKLTFRILGCRHSPALCHGNSSNTTPTPTNRVQPKFRHRT